MSLLDLLGQQLGGSAVESISQQVGADQDATAKAVSAALPMLVSALAKNSANEGGAASLLGALDRDHDGSILDDVGGFLGQGGNSSMGGAILGHMLGGRQSNAESAIGKASGLDAGQVSQIMAMLAPLVMGALSKKKQEGGLDAGGLASMLNQEKARVEADEPDAMGMVGRLLDADGDGDVSDDIMKLGGSLLGRMFSK